MAAFTALAIGLLGGLLASKVGSGGDATGDTRSTVGRVDPNAPTPLATPTPPPSTAQSAAAAVPAALDASDRVKKRAAAGDTLLTSAQIPKATATPQVQPARLIGT